MSSLWFSFNRDLCSDFACFPTITCKHNHMPHFFVSPVLASISPLGRYLFSTYTSKSTLGFLIFPSCLPDLPKSKRPACVPFFLSAPWFNAGPFLFARVLVLSAFPIPLPCRSFSFVPSRPCPNLSPFPCPNITLVPSCLCPCLFYTSTVPFLFFFWPFLPVSSVLVSSILPLCLSFFLCSITT